MISKRDLVLIHLQLGLSIFSLVHLSKGRLYCLRTKKLLRVEFSLVKDSLKLQIKRMKTFIKQLPSVLNLLLLKQQFLQSITMSRSIKEENKLFWLPKLRLTSYVRFLRGTKEKTWTELSVT